MNMLMIKFNLLQIGKIWVLLRQTCPAQKVIHDEHKHHLFINELFKNPVTSEAGIVCFSCNYSEP